MAGPTPLHELFVDDGELDVGQICRGREAIRGWGQAIEEAELYPGIRHLASNMRFVATGADAEGRDTAKGITVLTVFLNDADGRATSTPWVVGEDHDRFVRTDAGWRFTHRSWVQLFAGTDRPSSPGGAGGSGPTIGPSPTSGTAPGRRR